MRQTPASGNRTWTGTSEAFPCVSFTKTAAMLAFIVITSLYLLFYHLSATSVDTAGSLAYYLKIKNFYNFHLLPLFLLCFC